MSALLESEVLFPDEELVDQRMKEILDRYPDDLATLMPFLTSKEDRIRAVDGVRREIAMTEILRGAGVVRFRYYKDGWCLLDRVGSYTYLVSSSVAERIFTKWVETGTVDPIVWQSLAIF